MHETVGAPIPQHSHTHRHTVDESERGLCVRGVFTWLRPTPLRSVPRGCEAHHTGPPAVLSPDDCPCPRPSHRCMHACTWVTDCAESGRIKWKLNKPYSQRKDHPKCQCPTPTMHACQRASVQVKSESLTRCMPQGRHVGNTCTSHMHACKMHCQYACMQDALSVCMHARCTVSMHVWKMQVSMHADNV